MSTRERTTQSLEHHDRPAPKGSGASSFPQLDSMFAMVMVDADGKRLEVIVRDLGYGPRQWIRVSWHGVLLGFGYYRTVEEALAYVDAESLVEVIPHPAAGRSEALRP